MDCRHCENGHPSSDDVDAAGLLLLQPAWHRESGEAGRGHRFEAYDIDGGKQAHEQAEESGGQ